MGASRAPSCPAGRFVAACGQWKITGWGDGGGQAKPRLAPPRRRLRHCCMPWACLCRGFFLAFPGIEELALGIFVALPRPAHLCSHSSPISAVPLWSGVPHPKCSATKQGGSTSRLLPPLFAPQGLTPQARHLQMPWGSILLPARAGRALSCPSPAPRSLSTLYLICAPSRAQLEAFCLSGWKELLGQETWFLFLSLTPQPSFCNVPGLASFQSRAGRSAPLARLPRFCCLPNMARLSSQRGVN